MPLMPKRVKWRKQQRGSVKGNANKGHFVAYGDFGVQSLEAGWITAAQIEARPVWKPMHLQPVFAEFETVGGDVAARLFTQGLCLPSGSNLTQPDLERITALIRGAFAARSPMGSRSETP